MAMSREGFLDRLKSAKAVNCTYQSGEFCGLISVWFHDRAFVLTWEECKAGDQYNEQSYTRDENHRFQTAEEVLAFVEAAGYPASAFTP